MWLPWMIDGPGGAGDKVPPCEGETKRKRDPIKLDGRSLIGAAIGSYVAAGDETSITLARILSYVETISISEGGDAPRILARAERAMRKIADQETLARLKSTAADAKDPDPKHVHAIR